MTDNEAHVEAGLHPVNPFLPGVYARAGFTRRWVSRGTEFTQEVATSGGVDLRHLEQLIGDDDDLGDLYQRLIERALSSSDATYRRALARLVGRALSDKARIDDLAALGDTLVRLQPVDLRVFITAYTEHSGEAVVHPGVAVKAQDLARRLDGSSEAFDASLGRLASVGLIQMTVDANAIGGAMVGHGGPPYSHWATTIWGARAAELCREVNTTPG